MTQLFTNSAEATEYLAYLLTWVPNSARQRFVDLAYELPEVGGLIQANRAIQQWLGQLAAPESSSTQVRRNLLAAFSVSWPASELPRWSALVTAFENWTNEPLRKRELANIRIVLTRRLRGRKHDVQDVLLDAIADLLTPQMHDRQRQQICQVMLRILSLPRFAFRSHMAALAAMEAPLLVTLRRMIDHVTRDVSIRGNPRCSRLGTRLHAIPDPHPSGMLPLESCEAVERITTAIKSLPHDFRQIIQFKLDGLTLDAIAMELGSSKATIWRRYREAMTELLEKIKR